MYFWFLIISNFTKNHRVYKIYHYVYHYGLKNQFIKSNTIEIISMILKEFSRPDLKSPGQKFSHTSMSLINPVVSELRL